MDKDDSLFMLLDEVVERNIYELLMILLSTMLVQVMFPFDMEEFSTSIMYQILVPICCRYLS
jgi:hypothetical protein